ncbi:MAG: LamB/YcsF family protein [Nocardioides sp.]
MLTVDLNADLGEEVTDDDALLAVVTSANVACGYHAGTPDVMRRVCAAAGGVVVGAQVSYADRANFGRVELEVAASLLTEQVADQVGTLETIARSEGTFVRYLKPHGALYHRVARDPVQAAAVLAGSGRLPVLGLPGSVLLALAEHDGREVLLEGFADRAYRDPQRLEGGLVPRTEPGAVHDDDAVSCAQAVALAERVDSVCVHGDTPGAVGLAHAVRRALEAAGYAVRPPAALGTP